jgi:hypothetical protein
MSEEININPEENEEATETEVEVEAAPEVAEKVNPAYEKILAELPEAWHAKIMPHLKEQGKDFQSQLDKFEPFKEFMDYDATVIRDSLKLADVAVNDPVSLYRNLAEHLRSQGMIEEAEVAEETADAIEEDGNSGDYEMDPAIRREFESRDEKIAEQQRYMDDSKFQAEVVKEQAILESQVQEVNSKYDIPQPTMDRILKLMEVQLDRGEDATIYTAARELAEITGVKYKARSDLPREAAPMVLGTDGGAGMPSDAITIPKDGKGKKEMLEQMFQAQLKGTANSL